MKKFLNFSTILFSYVLVTVLVISCGGSSGGGGGTGSAGNGGNVPQADLNDKTCLLSDRDDKDAVVAVLCQTDSFIGLITKTTPAGQDAQQINLLIPSTERTAGSTTSRTWDLSKAREIQISHVKDYTLALVSAEDGSIAMIADATDATTEPVDAAYLLQLLTIDSYSFFDQSEEQLRSIGISFSPASGSPINAAIAPKLAVKSQEDFISMGRFTEPPLGELKHPLSYVLANDLDLVAPGEEGAKFNDSIIPVVDASFDFDGGGHTISLNSAIDAVAENKPAAIIGQLKQSNEFKNFTLDVNQPISGHQYVGTIVGYIQQSDVAQGKIHNINININSNLTVYQLSASAVGSVGGVAGRVCFDINNVVVKTAKDVAIKADVKSNISSGGLAGYLSCEKGTVNINNNVVDVTLEFFADNSSGDLSSGVRFGGLSSYTKNVSEVNNNLVNLAISRGNLPAYFAFFKAAGLSTNIQGIDQVTNNLVYVDFSNLGKVQEASGLFLVVGNDAPINNKTANNMLFIADGFDGSSVTTSFGAAFYICASALNFTDNFVSSPVTAYSNLKLASLLYKLQDNFYFTNLILDNKDAAVMFKEGGTNLNNARNRVSDANLFTLAEAKTNEVSALFSAGNTSWEEGSQGYPQLKAPADFSEAKKADWDRINGLIQTGLADRANK